MHNEFQYTKFFKDPLYQEIRYIVKKYIIDCNNSFQISKLCYNKILLMIQFTGLSNFTVYFIIKYSLNIKKIKFQDFEKCFT